MWEAPGSAEHPGAVMSDEAPFQLIPGGAVRIRGYTECGEPHIVEVSAAVARRAKFLRLQFVNVDDQELHCAMFQDESTGEVYGQPVAEPAQPAEEMTE